jgi:hypothetical protein
MAAPEGSSGATPTDRLKCRRRVAAVPMPVRAAIVSMLASVGLEELLRQVHALVVQPPQGCRADGGDEVPAQVAGAHVGEVVHGQWFVQALGRPLGQVPQVVAVDRGRGRDELGLATRAVRGHHEPAGEGVDGDRAVVVRTT